MQRDSWHTQETAAVLRYFSTNEQEGLSVREALKRQHTYGKNEIAEHSRSVWRQLLAQFKDFMVMVLAAAALVAGFLGEYVDAVAILAIVCINAGLGFLQEFRAEKSLQALRRLAAPKAQVWRDGQLQQIAAKEVVPGDIIVLSAGDKVAADARVLEAQGLAADEAALTGEAAAVAKTAEAIAGVSLSLGDRSNMVYAGTGIVRGHGRAVVCAIGLQTEFGQIAALLRRTEDAATPLERRLEKLGRIIVVVCLFVCVIVAGTGIMKGEPVFLMCMAGISLAVAAIPEGLPAIVTVSLALGVQRMIGRRAIVRHLPAVETLGCTTVICSDKTGTLTQNVLTVRQVYAGNGLYTVTGSGYGKSGGFWREQRELVAAQEPALLQCLRIAALCNNSQLTYHAVALPGLWRTQADAAWSITGDPTEGALLAAAAKADLWRQQLAQQSVRRYEIPFSSERRYMAVVEQDERGYALYVKGALDTLLPLCRYYQAGEAIKPLTDALRAEILTAHQHMTTAALRVIATAFCRMAHWEPGEWSLTDLAVDLVFGGLCGMSDPPRPEVKDAVRRCRQAGIQLVMITGDHPQTAAAIGMELELYDARKHRLLTGTDIEAMSVDELARAAAQTTVYARVSPAHKLKIVQALQARGQIVAMTGDGVNDAPAMKAADIGIAMGQSGTEVAKEASAMILADDNFATIAAAVEEGRGIYDNIRKFIRYLLACNLGEVLTMFIAALAGMPLPLLPVQLLWVNLITDGFPALALGADQHDPASMQRPPRRPNESVLSRGMAAKILLRGGQIGGSTIVIFWFVYTATADLLLARTMAFSTLVLAQLFHVFDCRSETDNAFAAGIGQNKYLVGAVVGSLALQGLVLYHPLFRMIFQTVPLELGDWLLVILAAGGPFALGGLNYLVFGKKQVSARITRI